jgi:hypothetical protein
MDICIARDRGGLRKDNVRFRSNDIGTLWARDVNGK